MLDTQKQLPRPLGDAQVVRREAEQRVRHAAVQLSAPARAQSSVAAALCVAPQTLNSWTRRHAGPMRGRPRTPIDPLAEAAVTELLDTCGRSVGVPALKSLFNAVPRSRLQEIRKTWLQRQSVAPHRLYWSTPGAVWSTDFTQPSEPIDGLFDHVLVVRDLASQCTLLAAPCVAQSAETVVAHLGRLFARHGAPLVLKSDNGSPFIAELTRQLCTDSGVLNLLSPPLTPQYNGSVEATGGQLKSRAAILAQLHACHWTSDILEAARIAANAWNRPWGPSAPTPAERWQHRSKLTDEQRRSFNMLIVEKSTEITRSIQRERLDKGLDPTFTAACKATVARTATRQALVELGYLQVRKPPIMSTESNDDSSEN